MPHYHFQGTIPHKRHTVFRSPSGRLRYEELISTRGFDGPYALLYHEEMPVEVLAFEPGSLPPAEGWTVDVRRNHLWSTNKIDVGGDPFDSRRLIAYNDDVSISVATPDCSTRDYYRNGEHDELLVISQGTGSLITQFGVLEYEEGDMIVIPRGTIQKIEPNPGATRTLIVESRTDIAPPSRYFVTNGQMAEHSPFCERDFRLPKLQPPIVERGEYRVVTKHGDGVTIYTYPNHPFDVVGWDGTLYPYILNVRDFEPLSRRIHTMPDEHQAFGTQGAAILCFMPRILEWHPDALPAPPVHANVDCDEILYNFGGPLIGRRQSEPGEISFHPRGLLHGPKVFEEMIGVKEFNGRAIAIDTFKPLRLTKWAKACDDPDYHLQWARNPMSDTD